MTDELNQPDTGAMPDFEQNFAPGELSAVEGHPWGIHRQNIPENYQAIFRDLCKKVAMRDQFARIEEVKKAATSRFYWRGMFDAVWNEDQAVWTQIGMPVGPGLNNPSDTGDDPVYYPFNIYQAFGREHITIVASPWKVRMEATKIDSPDAQRISSGADSFREKIEAQNDLKKLRTDAARLAWTDGRVSFYSRWVTDGARFGYEDEREPQEVPEGLGQGTGQAPKKRPRKPKGGEMITAYGVLECKVPINMREQADFPYRQLAFEIDLSIAKANWPWVAERLKGGEPGPGEYTFDRTSRVACQQGIKLLAQAGDTIQQLPTWQQTWLRPAFFSEVEDQADREWLEDNYPDGAYVSFIGDAYVASRNESMDDHWHDIHPVPGDGQATPPCGWLIIPVQDAVCDMTDLSMETFMKAIPSIWIDKESGINLQALSKQRAEPGAYRTLQVKAGQPATAMFYPEPVPEMSTAAQEFFVQLFGNIPQFLTGLYPAAVGEADPDNQTVRGIQMLSQASKGQSGVAWGAFVEGYAKSMEKLVRIGAYFRAAQAKDGVLELDQTVIDLEDLRPGNWACKPDNDQGYPNTHSERQQAFQQFAQMAGQTPEGQAIIFDPKNLELAKDLIGLQDLEIPGADSAEKQMAEIKQLMAEVPIPNQQAMMQFKMAVFQAASMGQQPPPQPPPEAFLLPSVEIDPDFDLHDVEYATGKDWVNSPQGQQAKRENPEGFMNVKLHLKMHNQALQQAQQAQMQQQIQMLSASEQAKQAAKPKPTPSESIQFKDLGPSGRMQVGAQAGLDLHADVAAELAGEAMGEGDTSQQKPQPKPTSKPS
jgi:hypothetical protein